jgi:hypothetical protein
MLPLFGCFRALAAERISSICGDRFANTPVTNFPPGQLTARAIFDRDRLL